MVIPYPTNALSKQSHALRHALIKNSNFKLMTKNKIQGIQKKGTHINKIYVFAEDIIHCSWLNLTILTAITVDYFICLHKFTTYIYPGSVFYGTPRDTLCSVL